MHSHNSPPFPITLSPVEQDEIQRRFITRVYGWMVLGLLVTAATAFMTFINPNC